MSFCHLCTEKSGAVRSRTTDCAYFCTAIEQILYQVNFDNRAFLVGVEDEGSVGVLIAIEVGEGQTVSFEFFRQIPEGLLDVDEGVADMQTLRRLDVVGDGRWRMLSLQRISPVKSSGASARSMVSVKSPEE